MLKFKIHRGDSLQVMKQFEDLEFDACSFSPPYGKGQFFDPSKTSFSSEGNFMDYMRELGRICKVIAINFTQLTEDKWLLPFTEELIQNSYKEGICLFDRWIIEKPTFKPRRGSRAICNYEFVLLFTGAGVDQKDIVCNNAFDFKCLFKGTNHKNYQKTGKVNKHLGTTPYFPEIPHQVFAMYGGSKVLDPFCGSGTSLIEAMKLNIECVGIELEPEIHSFAVKNCLNHYVRNK